jgi:hypothetical protein
MGNQGTLLNAYTSASGNGPYPAGAYANNTPNANAVANNEALLAGDSTRTGVEFVLKASGIPTQGCLDFTSANPDATIGILTQGSNASGFWKSTTPICFVVLKAGSDTSISSGKSHVAYEYPDGTLSGSWSTDMLDNKSVSHIDFYACDQPVKDELIIKKSTLGGQFGGPFTFSVSPTNPQVSVDLTTNNGNNPDESDPIPLDPDTTYTVTESVLNGWNHVSVQCTINGQDLTISPATPSEQNGTVSLSFDTPDNDTKDTIVCTFENEPDAADSSLTIIKEVDPDGDQTQFDFSGTGPNNTVIGFSLQDNDSGKVFDTLGQYNIKEDGETGYTLDEVTCVGDQPGDLDPADSFGTSGVSINLEAGENVTCVFKNSRDSNAKLTIVKEVIPDGDQTQFSFAGNGPNGAIGFSLADNQPGVEFVTPGQYTIDEDGEAGYALKSVQCVDDFGNGQSGDSANTTDGISVTLEAGEEITCTFTNMKEDDDPGDEETKRFIHRRVDNLLTHGPDRARLLRRVQEQRPSLKDGPMKLAGTTLMSAPAGMTGSGGGALHLGAPETGVPWLEAVMGRPEEEPFGMVPLAATGPTSSSSALLSSIAGKLMPLMEGQTSFKFGTSLSEIRTNIAEAEARSQQKKLQDAGLSFEGQPYTNPFLGVREGLDFWIEGHITRYRDDIGGISREGDFRILYVGADYVLADGVLIGGLVQIDDTEEDIDDPTRTGEIDGTGWMVGPYFGARVLDNLFFDARAAWGQSDNDIWIDDAGGFRTGSFDTERWLATATLTGVHYHGAWRFSPQIGVAYGHESYDTYVNSLGQTIAGSEANIGRLNGGGEIAYRIERSSGTIVEPMVSLTGIWNFDSDDLVINGVTEQTDETRAKVEGGVMIRTPAGWALRAAGMYDGLGSDDFEAYGGSLWVNIPIYKPD